MIDLKSRYYSHPLQMNLELTTSCPLRCPQCYVSLCSGRNLPPDRALYWIRQAAGCGIEKVNLSGGETLCYPWLDDVIRECGRCYLTSAVSLSGALATEDRLQRLIDAGVDEIYVSLNGSTEEINAETRDGYGLAVHTLELLRKLGFRRVFINYVMHTGNAADLPNMLALAEKYGVKSLVILSFKPDSRGMLESFPARAQLEEAARFIKSYRGNVEIAVESCFPQLRVLLSRSWINGNTNCGIERGCGAGRDGISVNVDGVLTPCRHLDHPEPEYSSIMEYWNHSKYIKALRSIEDERTAPCRGCRYEDFCLPCADISEKLFGSAHKGFWGCPVCTPECGSNT